MYAEAFKAARKLQEIWGNDFDQIEWHMESDGFSDLEILFALQELYGAVES